MFIGVLTVDLHIPESGSLKGRRSVVKGMKDRIRSRFNVSVAEVGETELWQRVTLGVACVSGDKTYAGQTLDKVLDVIRSNTSVEMLDYHVEML